MGLLININPIFTTNTGCRATDLQQADFPPGDLNKTKTKLLAHV